jgi:trimethylamine--corrinoid protein Co-methyltransferase
LAGANLIYGAGMIESGVALDFGQMVMDNEFARMVRHAVGGVAVTDELLGVDDIAEVGPFGDFLSLDSTLKFMRSQSQPRLIDRRVREDWAADGGSDLHARATAEAQRLLDEHEPEPIPDDVRREIRAIVDGADRDAEERSRSRRASSPQGSAV